MKIQCSSCNSNLRVPERLYGKKGKCPKCGNILIIPDEPEPEILTMIVDETDPHKSNSVKKTQDDKILILEKGKTSLKTNEKYILMAFIIVTVVVVGIVVHFTGNEKTYIKNILTSSKESNVKKVVFTYKIIREDVFDKPVKTRVDVRACVMGDLNKINSESVESLLKEISNTYMSDKHFRYHNPPTHIYIELYSNEKEVRTGVWLGTLYNTRNANEDEIKKAYIDPFYEEKLPRKEEINIDEHLISVLNGSASKTILKTETDKNMKIFLAYYGANKKACDEAEKKHPVGDMDGGNSKADDILVNKYLDLQEKLMLKYKLEIAQKYGITVETLEEIKSNGIKQYWEIPNSLLCRY